MRTTGPLRGLILIVVCGMVAGGLLVTGVFSQELAHEEKAQPAETDVSALVGGPLAGVFAKFGAPMDVFVSGPKSKNPEVLLDYGPFSFHTVDKKITQCAFWGSWKKPIHGYTIGDSSGAAINALGKPNLDIKNADGSEEMRWTSADPKLTIAIDFDKDKKFQELWMGPKEEKEKK